MDDEPKKTVTVEIRGWKTIHEYLNEMQESGELDKIVKEAMEKATARIRSNMFSVDPPRPRRKYNPGNPYDIFSEERLRNMS